MYKYLMMAILFIGWFILQMFIINKGDRKPLFKKGF